MTRQQAFIRVRKHSNASVASVFVLALAAWTCGALPGQPPKPDDQPAKAKADAGAASNAEADESLKPEEYIRLGLPAHDRDWSGDDMIRAAKVLALLAKKGNRYLPRYKSERSGEVFARVTSPQNLELLRNRSLPIGARFPQAGSYFQGSNDIFKLYVSAFVKKETRDSEMVELMASHFRTTVVTLDLVDEVLPTIKKNDSKYEVRMKGLEQVRRGLAMIVAGGLQSLTERQEFRQGEIIRLVGYMEETYPQIVPRLPPGSRTETLVRLEKFDEDPTMKDLQPGLHELRLKVKKALDKEKAR